MAIDAYMVFLPNASREQTSSKVEIKGESTDVESKKVGSFEIISFSWGASAGKEASVTPWSPNAHGAFGAIPPPPPAPPVSGTTNKKHRVVFVENFKISKPFDLASPGLFMACVDPKCVFEKAEIIFRKSGGGDPFVYLKFVFTDVSIDSVEWKIESAEDGRDKPDQEDVKCSFQECEIFYSPQTETGQKATNPGAAAGSGNTRKSAFYKRQTTQSPPK